MAPGKLTQEVCVELGVPRYLIDNLFARGRLAKPGKDVSGRMVWTPQDVERLRKALAQRRPRRANKKPQTA